MFHLIACLAMLGVASAAPSQPKALLKRQSDSDPNMCRENSCTDCPLFFGTGQGWPDCPAYTGSQLTDNGFPVQENGLIQIFIDVPPQDDGCRTLIRTPVRPNDQNCGGNVLIAEGATCSPITIDNTFMVTFCCGVDDCTAAGAPFKRDLSSRFAASSVNLLLYDRQGNLIPPQMASSLQAPSEKAAKLTSRNDGVALPKSLSKRDCDGFTVTRGPYQSGGTNYIISDTVSCTPTQSCEATIANEVTETTTFSASVSVSDPLGIVSAEAGFEFSQSVTQTFSGTWTFGPGERGYVVFIPYITCVDGFFTGDCGDDGVEITICGGSTSGGNIDGERRGVLIRG